MVILQVSGRMNGYLARFWQKSCKIMHNLARFWQNLPESCKITIRNRLGLAKRNLLAKYLNLSKNKFNMNYGKRSLMIRLMSFYFKYIHRPEIDCTKKMSGAYSSHTLHHLVSEKLLIMPRALKQNVFESSIK